VLQENQVTFLSQFAIEKDTSEELSQIEEKILISFERVPE
jgi:hypothetical protein